MIQPPLHSTHGLICENDKRKLSISRYPTNTFVVRFETIIDNKETPLISELIMSQEAFQMLSASMFEFSTNIDRFKSTEENAS